MSQQTSIEWTDFSSNPLRYRDLAGKVVWACAKVSEGCRHCYSEAIAHRYRKGGPFSLAQVKKVEPFLDEKECRRLLTSKKLSGKRVFIGDMTDIFGEWVPFELLDRLYAIFAARDDVIFQCLSKRPERMAEYLSSSGRDVNVHGAKDGILRDVGRYEEAQQVRARYQVWPLPNVWAGCSCEDQEAVERRLAHLRACPAAVRFVSMEPLLGPINVTSYGDMASLRDIHWVIVGCESRGVRAGRFAAEYEAAARSIIDQCRKAGVAVFHKQAPVWRCPDCGCCTVKWPETPADECDSCPTRARHVVSHEPEEWAAHLRFRQFPRANHRDTEGTEGAQREVIGSGRKKAQKAQNDLSATLAPLCGNPSVPSVLKGSRS